MPRLASNTKTYRTLPLWPGREEWAHRNGARPLSALLCSCNATEGTHVHPRRSPAITYPINPETGQWIAQRKAERA